MRTISNFLVVGSVVCLWTFVLSMVVTGVWRIVNAVFEYFAPEGKQ